MRTLLAVASLMMLVGVGAGCGDDTTTASTADLAVGMDLSAVAHDMSMLNCAQILNCASNCTSQTCVGACIAEGKSASQMKAQALFTCAIGACTSDGGLNTQCISATITAGVTGGGVCASQGTACATDM